MKSWAFGLFILAEFKPPVEKNAYNFHVYFPSKVGPSSELLIFLKKKWKKARVAEFDSHFVWRRK